MSPKWRTISILSLAALTGMSLWFMTAAILPDIAAEQALSAAQMSRLTSAVQAGFVAGALLIAATGLADRVDPRRLLAACAIGSALATLCLLAVPLQSAGAVALRALSGALMAGVYPVAMKIATGWGVKDRGVLVGIVVGALALGKSLPFGLAWLGGGDWRAALIWGVVLAVAGGGLALLARLGPHHAPATAFRPTAIFEAWTNRGVRAAYLGYFGHMWELYVFWAWAGVAAGAWFALRLPADQAIPLAKLTALGAIAAGAPACVIAGLMADRLGRARIATWAMAASGTLAILTALSFGGPVWLGVVLFILWGIAVVPDSAQFSALVADAAPPHLAGSLLTLQTALGFGLTVVTVEIAPRLADALGWPLVLAGLALGPLFGIWGLRTAKS